MPNLDGTGPSGKGPKTGRGTGRCNGAKANNVRRGVGRGFKRRGMNDQGGMRKG